MIVYVLIRATRSHTEFYEIYSTREKAQSVADTMNARLRPNVIKYTVFSMSVKD